MKRYTKQYVEYEPSGRYKDTKGQRCGNCAYYNEDKCRRVEGRIDFDYHCVLWKPTTSQRQKERWK